MSDQVIIFDQAEGLALPENAIDEAAGTIKGVSIATAGVQAIGHQMEIIDENGTVLEVREWWTDAETLQTMLEAVQSIGQPLKAKMEHQSGLTEIVGEFDNFRIDGDHLRADFQRYETSSQAPHLMTLAKRLSKQFGVSVTATLTRFKQGAIDLMRAVEIESADFVDSPAINAGLFSKKNNLDKCIQKLNTTPNPNTTMTEEMKAELTELIGGIVDEKMSTVTDAMKTHEDRMAKLEEKPEEMSDEMKAEMSKGIEAVKTELSKVLTDQHAELSKGLDATKTELSAKVEGATQLSKALGMKIGASFSAPVDPNEETFAAALEAKREGGLNYLQAVQSLNKEKPELVKAELSRRGVSNINLL